MERSESYTSPIAMLKQIEELKRRVGTLENLLFSAKEVLNLEEAAMFLGISRSMLYKLTYVNKIPFYKPTGKLIFFEKCHLLEWVRQNKHMSCDEAAAEAERRLAELNKTV